MGLTTQCSSVPRFYRSLFDIVDTAQKRGIVFYGAGFWGEITWRIFRLFSVKPLCFCDDDPDKRTQPHPLTQAPVLDIDEAVRRYPNAVYLATVSNIGGKAAPRYRMNMALQERGVLSADSGFHASRYTFLLEDHVYAQINAPIRREEGVFHKEHLDRVVFLNHMGNSGILYLDQLMDSHPEILNIAMLGHKTDLPQLYESRLQYLTGRELAVEIASQMNPYLKCSLPEEAFFSSYRLAQQFYLDKEGRPEQRLYIDGAAFLHFLLQELPEERTISFAELIRCIFAAYSNVIGKPFDPLKIYWILYEMHQVNYDVNALDQLLLQDDFADRRYLFIVRESVRHCYSWLRRFVIDADADMRCYHVRSSLTDLFSCDLGLMLECTSSRAAKQVRIVRFEDLKLHRSQTMQAICQWLGISYSTNMEETTVNGISVYFPVSSNSSQVHGADSLLAVESCDYSDLFSEFDVLRLNLLFQYCKRACGYAVDVPDLGRFSMPFLEKLLKMPFRFERVIQRMREQDVQNGRTDGELFDYMAPLRKLLLSYAYHHKPCGYFTCIEPVESD